MFVQDLTWWLKHAAKKDDNIIMVGDLNICTLKRSSVNADYINMLSNYLFLPVIHTATREEMRDETLTTSCVDHINIKLEKSLKISSSVIMEKPADHWFIGCRVTKNGAPLPQEEKKTTIIETVNSRKVQQEIELTSWDNFKHIEDPEEMYRSIVSTFNNIYEKSKRVYEKGEKDFQTPWVNQELRTEIHKKMTLLKQWRNSKKNPILYDLYTKQRNVVKNGIKKAKRKYLFRLFKQADGNMKKLWSLINQCMNRKIREPADEMLKKNFQTDDLLSLSNQFNTDCSGEQGL
ncbi:hypothetical protein M8J77_007487 [Diaphorina citri]|nr:hypothetical protein M8J77_007487 [Diaphorina citri]